MPLEEENNDTTKRTPSVLCHISFKHEYPRPFNNINHFAQNKYVYWVITSFYSLNKLFTVTK